MTRTLGAVPDALSTDDKVRLVTAMLMAGRRPKMTTLELGAALGLGRTAIYDRMQGRKAFTVAEVVRMGEILGVAPDVFLVGPSALLVRRSADSNTGDYRSRTTAAPVARTPYARLRAVA